MSTPGQSYHSNPIPNFAATKAGIRVVVLEKADTFRAQLRAAVQQHPTFQLTGEAQDWFQCVHLLEETVPELLLARLQSIPAHWWNETREVSFPLVIGVGDSDIVKSANARLVQTLPLSVDTAGLRSALVRAESLVYTQKAQELSYLLRQYTSNAAPSMYLASIKVEHEGHKVPLDTRTIMAILASANYCRLHTDSGDYEIRETMNGISAKLDPTVFARIHRSVIVNTSQVREVALSNDVPRAVILRDGMELPVGPNFRHSLQELVLRKRA